ncbi:RagB/SusD family nutrient uptake outer membrane protein [Rufibacter glacialis]|uniref:RagB/SusD family nutrient uptake outer membrane protein n=1 Tax=Rufibacter glacialis TaxID=1259555 RepID=A0A5M8QKV0_9BACT|nr:RagB/SusD family nutrient uptake outer membrane protein [Rufibacter glacialis]KAA6435610.1 RagB/SusD family nutrient uptake outer membrane protein [Rufibacter glacialis]GGK64958.1 starch-binding protein [Rufibacter glacialis]
MINRYILAGALAALAIFSGCKDEFLERPPLDTLTDGAFFRTDAQVLAATAPLYNVAWKNYHDQASYFIGDIRGGTLFYPWEGPAERRDNVFFRATGVSKSTLWAYQACYNVIGQSNMAIYNINKLAGPDVTAATKNQAIGEARFMRATAYSILVTTFGEIPIITDNVADLNSPGKIKNTVPSIWEFITRDYLFAADNLPVTASQPGRVTKWSAEGMLARTYLTRAGVGSGTGGQRNQEFLNKAKEYAQRVITQSGKALVRPYENLFKYPYDNNAESLFENQWVFGAYATANTMASQIYPMGEIAVNNDGWGGNYSATWWMMSLYDGLITNQEDGNPANDGQTKGFTMDQRLKATFMLPGFHYPEITVKDAKGQAKEKLTWAAPGATADNNFAVIKKYVVGNELDLAGQAGQQNYPHNTYMMRLAEMYLTYVDAAIGNAESTSDPIALQYFNEIRTRAGLPSVAGPIQMSRNYPLSGDDQVFEEWVKEFAMENLTWYELVRIHYYNPQKAYNIINNQDRALFLAKPDRFPNPTGWTFTKTSWMTERNPNVGPGNFFMPLPAVELSQSPSLNQPAVDYKFEN